MRQSQVAETLDIFLLGTTLKKKCAKHTYVIGKWREIRGSKKKTQDIPRRLTLVYDPRRFSTCEKDYGPENPGIGNRESLIGFELELLSRISRVENNEAQTKRFCFVRVNCVIRDQNGLSDCHVIKRRVFSLAGNSRCEARKRFPPRVGSEVCRCAGIIRPVERDLLIYKVGKLYFP